MAVIDQFQPLDRERELKLHPTHVVGHYGVFKRDGRAFLQIDTLGSADRAKPNSQSQTFQLTAESAKALWEILGREFNLST